MMGDILFTHITKGCILIARKTCVLCHYSFDLLKFIVTSYKIAYRNHYTSTGVSMNNMLGILVGQQAGQLVATPVTPVGLHMMGYLGNQGRPKKSEDSCT